MSGGSSNNGKDNKAEEGGWASTFLKVAGAVASTAAVADSLYSYQEVILKVDGSLLRGSNSAGCGGFLSSASEKWICGFAQKLVWNPNLREDETEREAILRGLLWVKEKGKKKVVVKTDNEGNANLVNSGRRSTDPVICRIRDLLNSDQWEASLSWIRGSENAIADRLAHKAHSFTSYDLQEFDDPPQNCLNFKIANSSIMSGGSSNNGKDNKDEEEGWASTFLKVAGAVAAVAAAAAVAGSVYSAVKKPEAAAAPFGVQQPFHYQEEVILKVDGSLLRGSNSAGCGGFLSSASEKWICGFTQKLVWNPNLREDETEREAILSGLLWVKEKGEKKVVVKTDNEGNANLVNSGRRCNDPVICRIRNLLNSDQWEASLSWIGGSENAVADRLAHKAHSITSYDLQEFDDPPQNCLLLL